MYDDYKFVTKQELESLGKQFCIGTPTDFVIYQEFLFQHAAYGFIGHFEVTWHLTVKLFPALRVFAGAIGKFTASQDNSTLLHTNVGRRPPFYMNSNEWYMNLRKVPCS